MSTFAKGIAAQAVIRVRLGLAFGTAKIDERARYPWQIPPTSTYIDRKGKRRPWRTWLMHGGRGIGKTEGAARWAIEKLRAGPIRLGVGAPTRGDARAYCAEGETGLLTLYGHEFKRYNRQDLEAQHNSGAFLKFQGSEESARWNGPQWHALWLDELGLWKMGARGTDDSYTQAQIGLRLGEDPQMLITTTVKRHKLRNVKVIKALIERADKKNARVARTFGTTYEAHGLSDAVLEQYESEWGGTELGKQEMLGLIIEAVEGALWQMAWIDDHRVNEAPDLDDVVVAIDPSGSSNETSDEVGIVVAGVGECDCQGEVADHGFILDDGSGKLAPQVWARRAVALYKRRKADKIVAETNFGGDMVEAMIANVDEMVPYEGVVASRGKAVRAQPVAQLYSPKKAVIHHVGVFDELEEQLCSWVPGEGQSPDRLDALVWALTALIVDGGVTLRAY